MRSRYLPQSLCTFGVLNVNVWLSLPLRVRDFRIQILVWKLPIMTEGFLRSMHFRQVLEYCRTKRQPPLRHKIICNSSLTSMLALYVVVEKVSLNKQKKKSVDILVLDLRVGQDHFLLLISTFIVIIPIRHILC